MRKNKFFILFILLFFISCDVKRVEDKTNDDKKTNDIYDLVGKKIVSVDSILSDRKHEIIFLFNYYDCGSCIDSGFSITKRIDSLYGDRRVNIVSIMGDPSSYQKRNHYYDYIYIDQKDLIRKEMKYIQTPIILLLDSLNCVKDYIFPNASDDGKVASFIELTSCH